MKTKPPKPSKPTYTTKIHARRLLSMLSKKDPCMRCPAGPRMASGGGLLYCETNDYQCSTRTCPTCAHICRICKTFVGLGPNQACPCYELGREAIKASWIALEALGMTDHKRRT